jgi:hypothetical protein
MLSLVNRKSLLNSVCALLLLAIPAAAQYRGAARPRKTNPRAVAVLQVLPQGTARLLPVSIFLDGKYYDARYYMAKPVPLALYDQTVYEALPNGMPGGWFTVHTAQISPTVIWGDGDWKPLVPGQPSKKSKTSEVASDGKGVDTVVFHGTIKETKEERKQDKRDEKAAKKKKEERGVSSTPPPTNPPNDDNDPDRPILKKAETKPQVTLTPYDISPQQPPYDSDRPLLTRAATGEQEKTENLVAPTAGIPGAKYIVAVSDPDPMENRSFEYHWTDAEKAKYTQELSTMAMDAVRKFAKSGDTRVSLAQDAKFSDVEVRGLDIDYSNSPYLVFTGRIDPTMPQPSAKSTQGAPEQLGTYYATLVIRVGASGDMHRLMTKVTDSKHLDMTARYELIDAVDANGDNRAELLFRRTNDAGSKFVLYQVTPFQLTQVFEGGSAL